MEILNKIIKEDFKDQEDYAQALRAFSEYLEHSSSPLDQLDITPYRLAEIFSKHVTDNDSISLLISFLSDGGGVLESSYFYEDDEGHADLDEVDVYNYISKKSTLSPVTGESIDNAENNIFVVYHLSDKALQND